MAQPVVDTLELSETLRESGMEPEQAAGVARALGDQLGEHVAVRGDLDLGFEKVRGETALMRTELDASIQDVRADMKVMRGDMKVMRTELDASIEKVRTELGADVASFRREVRILLVAFGLMSSVLLGFGAFDRLDRGSPPPETVRKGRDQSGNTVAKVASSAESTSPSPTGRPRSTRLVTPCSSTPQGTIPS